MFLAAIMVGLLIWVGLSEAGSVKDHDPDKSAGSEAGRMFVPVSTFLDELWKHTHDPRIRSSEATLALTEKMLEFRPRFLHKRSVSVLYPGSGSHITPLDIAHLLIDRGLIDRAEFIFTEIEPTYCSELETILTLLVSKGYYTSFSKKTVELEAGQQGSETILSIVRQDKVIQLIFALNRSGQSYFRPEYLDRADIFYLHDLGAHFPEILPDIVRGFQNTSLDRQLFLMGENLYDPEIDLTLLPQSRQETYPKLAGALIELFGQVRQVSYGYGHRGNWATHNEQGPYFYKSGMLVLFDPTVLGQLKQVTVSTGSRTFSYDPYSLLTDFIVIAGMGPQAFPRTASGLVTSVRDDRQDLHHYYLHLLEFIRQFAADRLAKFPVKQAQFRVAIIKYHYRLYQEAHHEGFITERTQFAEFLRTRHFNDVQVLLEQQDLFTDIVINDRHKDLYENALKKLLREITHQRPDFQFADSFRAWLDQGQ